MVDVNPAALRTGHLEVWRHNCAAGSSGSSIILLQSSPHRPVRRLLRSDHASLFELLDSAISGGIESLGKQPYNLVHHLPPQVLFPLGLLSLSPQPDPVGLPLEWPHSSRLPMHEVFR